MTSVEPPALLEHVAAALAQTHNQTLTTRGHHGSIRSLHRALEEHVGRMLANLQAGDPNRIRKLPYTQWLLDNGHVLRATLQQIETALPRKYYRQLPTVADSTGGTGRQPRVVCLVSKALEIVELPLDLPQFEHFCSAYQTKAYLTIGELWALPTLLRISLLQKICHSAEQASRLSRSDPQSDAMEKLTSLIAGCITSLRNISAYQWQPFVERISCVDEVLRQDPVALYATMEFETRDDYRNALERISKSCNVPEWDIASAALELAKRALKDGSHPRRHHVGYFLIIESTHFAAGYRLRVLAAIWRNCDLCVDGSLAEWFCCAAERAAADDHPCCLSGIVSLERSDKQSAISPAQSPQIAEAGFFGRHT